MKTYEVIEAIMQERSLTIAQIARMSHLPDSTVRGIVKRKQKSIALDVAIRLSDGLGVSLECLNGQKNSPAAAEPEARENELKIRAFLDALSEFGVLREGQKLTPEQIAIVRAVLEILQAAFQGGELDNQVDQVSAP